MNISIIVAMASNRAIGLDNRIPWHLSADLKKFKAITMGSPIVMGRKTYESIGQPLHGRMNIIISRNPNYQIKGCLVFNNVEKAIEAYQHYNEIFVIGGASLYQSMLPQANRLYLTQINKAFEGDTFFPVIKEKDWREIAHKGCAEDDIVDFSYSFVTLERKRNVKG